ncbi:MAG: putative transposase [Thermomicrobiales bacterium]|nr:putative transposase [Thermomicrobiales bacterium]
MHPAIGSAAQMIVRSWEGLRTTTIARELGCHPQTARGRLTRFNTEGVDGLGDRPGPGRRPRLTEDERSRIVALAWSRPPGAILRQLDGALESAATEAAARWSLDALAAAAQVCGIPIGRSQVRRILRKEGVRWRGVHPWAESDDPDFAPKGLPSSRSTPRRRRTAR